MNSAFYSFCCFRSRLAYQISSSSVLHKMYLDISLLIVPFTPSVGHVLLASVSNCHFLSQTQVDDDEYKVNKIPTNDMAERNQDGVEIKTHRSIGYSSMHAYDKGVAF
uniref:Uncharacterized protein n=1 Tax=Lotharella globosa TaxID=91324 RepID=A0A7S3Z0S1_9EUKA